MSAPLKLTKVRHRRLTFIVTHWPDGRLTIGYSSKKFGPRSVNPASQLADELREVKPEAFAPPQPEKARR